MGDSLTAPENGIDPQRGHTLLDLRQRDDGTWVVTQHDVDTVGTGETGALAAMDYCRKIAEGTMQPMRELAARQFRCRACGQRFDDMVRPGTCPRCGAIGDHREIDHWNSDQ